jgi:hypothetical protein
MRYCLFSATIAISLVAPAAGQVYVPIPVTGYTQDVIADAVGAPSTTTSGSFDNGLPPFGGFVLYQQGYNAAFPNLGVPATGSIITSPTRSYQLGPIAGKNSIQLFPTAGPTSGTLTLVTPSRYAALSLLLADGGGSQPSQGGWQYNLAVNWSNGNSTSYNYVSYDWFLLSGTPGPNSGVAIAGLDRADRTTGVPNDNTVNPDLFYYDIDLSADPNYLAGALIDSVTASRPASTLSAFPNVLGGERLSCADSGAVSAVADGRWVWSNRCPPD